MTQDRPSRALGTLVPLARALLTRPHLWPAALSATIRLARPGWWRRWPPLPEPDLDYWRFRMVTAYGGDDTRAVPPADDLVAYLDWYRAMRAGSGQR
jgi:hypothetical protein